MPPNIRDFRASQVLSDLNARPEIINPRMLEAAAVSAEHLTGDPDWDAFLRKVQSRIDDEQRILDDFAGKVWQCPNGDVYMSFKSEYWVHKGRMDAMKELIAIPRDLTDARKTVSTN